MNTDFLSSGGELGALMRSVDWSATGLGAVESWPVSLRSAVSICVGSRFPIVLYWGPARVVLYNDAYAEILGKKHPWALGRPCREVWSEIWDVIEPMLDGVAASGQATWSEDQLLILERRGDPEECYFSFSFSPVRNELGAVEGIFTAVIENTRRVLGERRLRTLSNIAERLAAARDERQAWLAAAAALSENPEDLPHVALYRAEDGAIATLAAACGPGRPAIRIELPFVPVEGVEVVPVPRTGATPYGCLVAGINPRRPLDNEYRAFLELVAGHIAGGLANALAREEEHKRAEALAELDRTKTAFFSNVSHEFRTPLTLMLGPVEEMLAGREPPLEPASRELLEVVQRNGLRMLRLVNTMLEFSRIEAGRIDAFYEPTDLASSTAELASLFRTACERAGLALVVDCTALPDRVFVDRDMWEKIVLNLLSNAFKYTLEGEIRVALRAVDGRASLSVIDTGVGIPAEELPRMFERFHRITNARGRTHEGTGIGLALVQELVKLHGGEIRVESTPGKGSCFSVSIPFGTSHLDPSRVRAKANGPAIAAGSAAFAEEALRWLPEPMARSDGNLPGDGQPSPAKRLRVLWAEDNSDLRGYVKRLLGGRFEVEAVADGQAALAAARRNPPDLVLSDVMMPGLDGYGLLRELRAGPETAEVPVILLSARAGEESRIEGIQARADDYLVKPFSARELVARVEAHGQISRIRRETNEALRDAARRKDEFLATLAHELRNPLAPIIQAVRVSMSPKATDAQLRWTRDVIDRQARHMALLLDDLLDVSRITRGQLRLRTELVELASIVDVAIETARPVIDAHRHRVTIDLPTDPIRLQADALRITQVLANLLTNAARYSEPDREIRVSARIESGYIVIRVRDSGIGIEPQVLPQLFDMFSQVAVNREHTEGLGIGLALVKGLVALHGGSVEARSEGRGRGSEFIVRLPTTVHELTVKPPGRDVAQDVPARRRRILIADDNEDAAESLKMLLDLDGHAVDTIHDGAEAVAAAKALKPDVMLLDIRMPEIGGYDVARHVRSQPWGAQVKLVAITGFGQAEDRRKSAEAGFDRHLTKPFDYETLQELLRTLDCPPNEAR